MRRAVFLDRDGVICRNRDDHVKSWDEFVFLPGAREALARLARLNLRLIVITNQAMNGTPGCRRRRQAYQASHPPRLAEISKRKT